MRRSFSLAALAVLLAGAAAWWLDSSSAPPPIPSPPIETHGLPPAPGPTEPHAVPDLRSEVRDPVRAVDDPEIRAALNACQGRVVDSDRRPVAGCGVRLYRGAFDAVPQDELEVAADLPIDAQRWLAGETRTAADGTFRIDGVWPRGVYLLLAGIGTGAGAHHLFTHAAAPGSTVDLGDIVLNANAGVSGTVVDDRGVPVAGALVRGLDVPGALLAQYPVEQVDPDGLLLLRLPDVPMRVFEFPAWAKALIAELPVPTTRSDRDGTFRLVGLVPGANVIVATQMGHLPAVVADVALPAGRVHELGRMALLRGEELAGRVVDAAGRPVAGAEVVAGSTSATLPVDAARRLEATDAEGRFRASGFFPGRVTVAVRRHASDPWQIAAPQPIQDLVVIVLPDAFALTVRVTDPAGGLVRQPQLRALAGLDPDAPVVELRERRVELADGRVRLDSLPAGDYVVLATGNGVRGSVAVALTADAEVDLALLAANEYRVRVVGPGLLPIRNAAVRVEGHEQGRDRAFFAGHTDGSGRVRVQTSSADLTVSADHPRWGCVHGRAAAGDAELVLHMQPPGRIEGSLREHGGPPPGNCAIRALHRPDVRGPIEPVPVVVALRSDGTFTVPALPPGRCEIAVLRAPPAADSAGSLLRLLHALSYPEAWPQRDVEVRSGETVRIDLDLGTVAHDGPTAHLSGIARIDGRPAVGCPVTLAAGNTQRAVEVDAAGRFDFGKVPAGEATVRLLADQVTLAPRRELWTRRLQLQADEEHTLDIAVAMVAVSGIVLRPDGSPAVGATVMASSRGTWHAAPTGADGSFAFPCLPAGVHRLEVRTKDNALRGGLVDVHTDGHVQITDLRIVLQPTIRVSGRIDIGVFGGRADFIGLAFLVEDPAGPDGLRQIAWEIAGADGAFATDDLAPGTYRLRAHARIDEWQEYEALDPIEVPALGVSNLRVRLGRR